MARCSGWTWGWSLPCWTVEVVMFGSPVGPWGRGLGPPICFVADAGTHPEPDGLSLRSGPAGVMPGVVLGELVTVRGCQPPVGAVPGEIPFAAAPASLPPRCQPFVGAVAGEAFGGVAGAGVGTRERQPDGLGSGAD